MARVAVIASLAVLGFALLAIGSVLAWLGTKSGAEELARFVANETRNAIEGDLRVRALRVGGFLRVCAEGVELRDPSENKVLSADRVCASVAPLALLRQQVVIRQALVERPWVEIARAKGSSQTTLQRAIHPRKPPQPGGSSGPFAWKIEVKKLELRGGSITVRPELGDPATFAVQDLDIGEAHARYAADSAAAALSLAAQLSAPGKAPVALGLDATMEGAGSAATISLRSLRLKLGESGFLASGSWDLARQAGEIKLRELVLVPRDLQVLVPKAPLEGAVRGEIDLKSDGKTAGADLRLLAGGGRVQAKLTSTLEKAPTWDVQLTVEKIDPGAISLRAPKGEVTARASLHGKGLPKLDEHGVSGELAAAVHVGPARLDRVGPVVADLDATLLRRYAIVKAFTATALGLELKARGAAAYDQISFDLDLRAKDLAQVGRATGALRRGPSLPLAGSARLQARVTGSPRAPEADVQLRAPSLRLGQTLDAEGLRVSGTLHGSLQAPDGSLRVAARRLSASAVDLGAPRIDLTLQWPWAHLRTGARVAGGTLEIAGDARIDEDKDGLVLSNFVISYPGNRLQLANDANLHFREQLILEPIDLVGEHGSVRLQAQVQPPPGRVDASLVISKFELDHLPQFVLPQGLGLHGVVDAQAVVQGPRGKPDLDVKADVRGAGAIPAGNLSVDAHAQAHVHHGILRTEGWAAGGEVLRLDFKGQLPVQVAGLPPNAPIQFEAKLAQLDLARLGETAKIYALQERRVHGIIDARVAASGTLASPRATLALDAHDVGSAALQQIDGRAGVLLDNDSLALDAQVLLGGEPALGLKAQAPFDLMRALREKGYLRGALERPLKGELAITELPLERVWKSGLLPAESSGTVSLSARLGGTPLRPTLQVDTRGKDVSVGRLHGLAYQGELAIADKVRATAGAQSQGDVVARLDGSAALSGAELVQLLTHRADEAVIAPLLDRAGSLDLEIPGLPIARASQLAGRPGVAEGRITGKVVLTGTGAKPRLVGQLRVQDLSAQAKKLGAADLYLEANAKGGLLHLAVDPPGGGNLLSHVKLDADLGGRTFLARGTAALREGRLSGDLRAKALDISFLSGLIPNLRRAGGTLEGTLAVGGTVARPTAEGEAHLRQGLFDVVGQGVYDDLRFDAQFSPREVLIDRITGSAGSGTFSAILVASRRPAPDGSDPDRVEFTGEIHLGDDESVRDRKAPGTDQPLSSGPVPLRQAGEQRADLSGELDLFGDYTKGALTVNGKIPDARLAIRQLPDKRLPSLKENPDVFLVQPGQRPHPPGRSAEEIEAEERARQNATFRLHAHLDLDHLFVKAPDFEFPVRSKMNFEYDARHPDTPSADGVVHVPSGSFNALGRRFTIEDAKIIETGGEIGNPELEVKATFDNPQAKVTITVTGTVREPKVVMGSNPPMEQDQIAFFLATGRVQGRATQSGGGVDLSGAATSVVGALLFGQVRKELTDVLPVDVITLDTSAQGVSGASVGKYIGDRVFIGYHQRFTVTPYENTVEGRLEYEITRALSAEVVYGDRNKDFSVLYTRDF
ncbi:MAG TPA: translocation/assembly module TamB domain-containing protein [Myxococcales bacterium]|nr:translocation/assembly module TamB domain-containing protein [Myxococcales bacterium]